MNLNFSANLNMLFTEVSFINRIKQAKESGFDNVEFLFPYDEGIDAIKKEIKRHNQNIVLFNLYYGEDKSKEWGTLSNPNRKEYFQQSFHDALEAAQKLECHQLNTMFGNKVEGVDPEMQIECAVNNLLWAASRAKEKGITLLVEQLNPKDFPKFFLSSLETAVSIIKKIQYENVKLLFDAYHVEMIGEDPIIMLEKYYDYIGHIQIADVPGRHEPGSGRINFNKFFSLLKRKNYQGYIGLEYKSSNSTKESLKWIKEYR